MDKINSFKKNTQIPGVDVETSLKQTKKSKEVGGYTFKEQRNCQGCGEPLPDQFSKKRKFCKEVRDVNGKLTKDCKGSYNRLIDKPELEVQREIIKEHKTVDDRIEAMVAKKGDVVGTADLCAYDIQLNASLKYRLKPNGTLESDFMKYTIISNPILHKHKINKHG